MSIDELVGRTLTDITDGLTPMPDPYGRVHKRFRRSQRRRRTTLALSLVGVTLAGITIMPGKSGPPSVADPESIEWTYTYLWWAERLVDSPTRGAVGADTAFVADLARQVAEQQRADKYPVKAPVRQVKVLFVDDVGPYRIAFVAFVLAERDSDGWPNSSGWLTAPAGATAEALATSSYSETPGGGLTPFEHKVITTEPPDGPLAVGIAPAGCQFASAPLPEATAWQPEPTGSYIVRTPQTARREWWQITCDGIVRMEGSSAVWVNEAVTESKLTEATRQTRGGLDKELSRRALTSLIEWGGSGTHVLWNGRTSGTQADIYMNGPFDGRAAVAVTRAARSGWDGIVDITYDTAGPDGKTGARQSFHTKVDPTDPSSVVAIRLGERTSTVLVITPVNAAALRTIGPQGQVLEQVPVQDAGVVMRVTNPEGTIFEALDANGAVIGRGTVTEQAGYGGFYAWNGR